MQKPIADSLLKLLPYRPRDLQHWACYWDLTERTSENVRRLVGLAGCRVEFAPCGDTLVAVVRLPGGKRTFDRRCVLITRGQGHIGARDPGVFLAEYELAAAEPKPMTVPELRAWMIRMGLGHLLRDPNAVVVEHPVSRENGP